MTPRNEAIAFVRSCDCRWLPPLWTNTLLLGIPVVKVAAQRRASDEAANEGEAARSVQNYCIARLAREAPTARAACYSSGCSTLAKSTRDHVQSCPAGGLR